MTRLALLRHADTAWSRRRAHPGTHRFALAWRIFPFLCPMLAAACAWSPARSRAACRPRRCSARPTRRASRASVEMSWGDWEGETLAALRARLGDEMRDNEARGLDFRPPAAKVPARGHEPGLRAGCKSRSRADAGGHAPRRDPRDPRRRRPAGTCAASRRRSSTGTRSHLFLLDGEGTPEHRSALNVR